MLNSDKISKWLIWLMPPYFTLCKKLIPSTLTNVPPCPPEHREGPEAEGRK